MLRTLVWLMLAMTLGACVRPWQREHLARPDMIDDQKPGEARFAQHARGAREGADGGNGSAGGGCGCN